MARRIIVYVGLIGALTGIAGFLGTSWTWIDGCCRGPVAAITLEGGVDRDAAPNIVMARIDVTGLDDQRTEVFLVIETPVDVHVPRGQPLMRGNGQRQRQLWIGGNDGDETGEVFVIKVVLAAPTAADQIRATDDGPLVPFPEDVTVIGELRIVRA